MITASKEFKEKLNNGANIVNYADITLSDGMVLHLTYKDFMIGGCSIEDKTTDGKFGVGFVIGKTLSIKIENHDERFSQYDFYNSIIRIYVAMQMDNGTIEKIRKGVYYATVPSTRGEIIEISAVDGMFLLDQDYSMSSLAYPSTLQAIITNACLECGIPIGFRQFDNMNFVVNEKPETGTYRQIVSYACQIAGYNARIDNDGYMQLIWYNSALLEQYNYVGGDFKTYPHDTILDGGNFKDYSTNDIISGGTFTDAMPEHIFRVKTLDVHTDDVRITGVRVVGEDDKTVLFGEEGYLIEVKNPFANGKEQEVANYLGGRMVGMMFRPFSAQILNNPLYEPFEAVRISDRKGNVYISILNSVSYKVGGYTQVACQAEDPRRNGSMYYSEAAAVVVEARRNTQKQLTTYDKAVQQMNQLAGNAMGFHTTYEEQPDGSRITYLHDKPTLSESKTIYKQTIDGFFISTDGGKSYAAGFDKNGNAVVNILYAIGIVADWIRGGTLTLGGMDNENGVLEILSEKAERLGYWDSSNFYIKSNDYVPAKYPTSQNFEAYSYNSTLVPNLILTKGSHKITSKSTLRVKLDKVAASSITITLLIANTTSNIVKTFSINGDLLTIKGSDLGLYSTGYLVGVSSNNSGIIYIDIDSYRTRFSPSVSHNGSLLNFLYGELDVGNCSIYDGFYVGGKKIGSTEVIGSNSVGKSIDCSYEKLRKFSLVQLYLKDNHSIVGCMGQFPTEIYDASTEIGKQLFAHEHSKNIRLPEVDYYYSSIDLRYEHNEKFICAVTFSGSMATDATYILVGIY